VLQKFAVTVHIDCSKISRVILYHGFSVKNLKIIINTHSCGLGSSMQVAPRLKSLASQAIVYVGNLRKNKEKLTS
jgi:hypothetical protein